MDFRDLLVLYKKKKDNYGDYAYQHITSLLKEAKSQHKIDFLKSDVAQKAIDNGRDPDHEQSWRAFKGKNLEKLIEYIIVAEIQDLGLRIINGNVLERSTGNNLPENLRRVRRNLLVDFGENGSHLPDVDLVIYSPETCDIIAVLSSKVTLRERVAQTGYWKLKLANDSLTEHIKVFFITPDEDGVLSNSDKTKKGRAIIENDTDGCYVLSEKEIVASDKVKTFNNLISDLKGILK
jgi:type II restriction enzyme